MELLLDICCFWVLGPVQEEKDSDKLGQKSQSKTYSTSLGNTPDHLSLFRKNFGCELW